MHIDMKYRVSCQILSDYPKNHYLVHLYHKVSFHILWVYLGNGKRRKDWCILYFHRWKMAGQ